MGSVPRWRLLTMHGARFDAYARNCDIVSSLLQAAHGPKSARARRDVTARAPEQLVGLDRLARQFPESPIPVQQLPRPRSRLPQRWRTSRTRRRHSRALQALQGSRRGSTRHSRTQRRWQSGERCAAAAVAAVAVPPPPPPNPAASAPAAGAPSPGSHLQPWTPPHLAPCLTPVLQEPGQRAVWLLALPPPRQVHHALLVSGQLCRPVTPRHL